MRILENYIFLGGVFLVLNWGYLERDDVCNVFNWEILIKLKNLFSLIIIRGYF